MKDIIPIQFDKYWKYKLTITTNIKYNSYNSLKNDRIFKHYCFDEFIKSISKLIRKKLDKDKRFNKIDIKELIPIDKHFLAITSFEARKKTDHLIHFHYLFSNFIKSKNDENNVLISKLEKEIFNLLNKQFKHQKKMKEIKDYQFDYYIPYSEYIKNNPYSMNYSDYILKEFEKGIYPIPFFSKELKRELKRYE